MQLEGISQDFKAFTSVLRACGKSRDIIKGHEVHVKVCEVGGSEGNVFIGSTLVDMYAKCGTLTYAHEVFDKLMVRNDVSWTTLIKGYIEVGFFEDAMNCFEQMQLEGVCPDSVTFICILNSCSSMFSEQKCLQDCNSYIGTSLIDMYAKFGLPIMAQEVFDKLVHRDVVIWTALIACLTEAEYAEKAIKCFERMQLEGISPNFKAFTSVLRACGKSRDIIKGHEVHVKVCEVGGSEGNVFIGSTLVDMYAKCGTLTYAHEVFDKLMVRNDVSWTTLIKGYIEVGFFEDAMNCFEQMQLEGVCPDSVTFICILNSCSKIGRLQFRNDHRLGCALVEMYGRIGALQKAHEVFEYILVKDIDAWNALIAAYGTHGCVDDTVRCFKEMEAEGISPNLATYVSLSKAYIATEDINPFFSSDKRNRKRATVFFLLSVSLFVLQLSFFGRRH
ncbi:hypothetical protein KP509_04G077100 [Ceratopteris richardii]|uniref:Pentatricopeptide repeat-containing protein n=1 Tax=Ceratopteris richardii TaxID=49495 RepID=A0A8T2UUH2_CERRI|nr:hypothetical protein KP509_04G077100 [Ceratopteris richardii]